MQIMYLHKIDKAKIEHSLRQAIANINIFCR